ncbi:MAG: LysR family transcriptional regulator [Oscillospiraceae bacterium]
MELRDLRFFCLTAEMEHVTNAADKLGVAQPFLTKIIRQVEEDVGGQLFTKVGRKIKLNSEGEIFYKHAKTVLADMDKLNAEMDYVFERKQQTITLMCNTESFATRLIRAFRDSNPQYGLSVLSASMEEMQEALTTGSADFAVSSPPMRQSEKSNIETLNIFCARATVLLPPGHRLLEKGKVTLDDLRGEKFITMPKKSGMRNTLTPIFEKYDFHPQIVFESNNLNMITQAVEGGFGSAIITELIIEDYPELKQYCVKMDIPENCGYYGLSYNKLAIQNRNVAHFLGFATKFFKDLQDYLVQKNG